MSSGFCVLSWSLLRKLLFSTSLVSYLPPFQSAYIFQIPHSHLKFVPFLFLRYYFVVITNRRLVLLIISYQSFSSSSSSSLSLYEWIIRVFTLFLSILIHIFEYSKSSLFDLSFLTLKRPLAPCPSPTCPSLGPEQTLPLPTLQMNRNPSISSVAKSFIGLNSVSQSLSSEPQPRSWAAKHTLFNIIRRPETSKNGG